MADLKGSPGLDDAPADRRVPTVVVDDVHITYTVNGARTGKGSATSALSRITTRRRTPGARQVHAVKGSASPRTRARPSA